MFCMSHEPFSWEKYNFSSVSTSLYGCYDTTPLPGTGDCTELFQQPSPYGRDSVSTNSDSEYSVEQDSLDLSTFEPGLEISDMLSLPNVTLASINFTPGNNDFQITQPTFMDISQSSCSEAQLYPSPQADFIPSPPSLSPPIDTYDEFGPSIELSDVEDDDVLTDLPVERIVVKTDQNVSLPHIGTVLDQQNEVPPFPQQAKNLPSTQDTTKREEPSKISSSSHRGSAQPRLSYFLVHALENPSDYGNMVRWINRNEGVFEFNSKQKENLARAWGKIKNNRREMSYQKMSRAMRLYIKRKTVMKKMKRKLQYSFLPDFLNKIQQSSGNGRRLSSEMAQIMYKHSRCLKS